MEASSGDGADEAATRDAGRCGDAGAMSSGKYNGSVNQVWRGATGTGKVGQKAYEAGRFGWAVGRRLIDKEIVLNQGFH
ncbi:hypothetical protein GIY62_22140 [Burkholderia plantarii]|uniref:hypothetical protein n=1 Tax=Burkholderia plantarii TaxID=41899 RepID=UPI00272DC779|nr:hypothetical protein [Burkholderia plantarii]WLE63051.1 hypothetical protein GIY62_22140 [Burkholderia plantarii]